MTRVGVIGVGGMGACHARHVHELSGAELAWVADPDQGAGESLAAEPGTRWLPEGMDALDDCDAVVIACPDRFHHRYVMAALARELPVLAEKPLTVELADAREIVDTEVGLGRRMRRELQVEPLILCLVQPAPAGTPAYKSKAMEEKDDRPSPRGRGGRNGGGHHNGNGVVRRDPAPAAASAASSAAKTAVAEKVVASKKEVEPEMPAGRTRRRRSAAV